MLGSALGEIEFRPALLSADTSVLAQKCAIRMAVRNQRANCPATSQYIVAAMFIMRTMVDERRNQINMPRLDAYRSMTISRVRRVRPHIVLNWNDMDNSWMLFSAKRQLS